MPPPLPKCNPGPPCPPGHARQTARRATGRRQGRWRQPGIRCLLLIVACAPGSLRARGGCFVLFCFFFFGGGGGVILGGAGGRVAGRQRPVRLLARALCPHVCWS